MSVYYSKSLNKAVVAYRGTRPTNIRDLTADAAIAMNTHGLHPRFIKAAALARKTLKKYGRENVRLTGHSLGGSLALYANQQLGDDAVETNVYNPGATPSIETAFKDFLYSKTRRGRRLKEKTRVYANSKDLVSKAMHRTGSYQLYIQEDDKGDPLTNHKLGVFLNRHSRDFRRKY